MTPNTGRKVLATTTTPVLSPPFGGLQDDRDALDPKWLTVFGFEPSMLDAVLRDFRSHGHIERHVSGKGNWVHILYRTGPEAALALAKPVRIVNGTVSVMVGVMECTDPGILGRGDTGPVAVGSPPGPVRPANGLPSPAGMFRPVQNSNGPRRGVIGAVSEFFFGW